MNIEIEEESLNITVINLLVRFNKTWEIFLIVTRVFKHFPNNKNYQCKCRKNE